MIKISPSISSFPLPPFQKQPSEHDTRGRRSSLFALGRRREKGISIRLPPPPPPLHYLHKSCLCRRRRHVCCERHSGGARPPTSCLVARPATCHSPSAAGPSVARASGKLCLFALVCLPALSLLLSDVPRLSLRIQAGFLAVVRSVRQHVAAVVDAAAVGGSRMWYRQKPFRKQLRLRIRVTGGKTDNCAASSFPSSPLTRHQQSD